MNNHIIQTVARVMAESFWDDPMKKAQPDQDIGDQIQSGVDMIYRKYWHK